MMLQFQIFEEKTEGAANSSLKEKKKEKKTLYKRTVD